MGILETLDEKILRMHDRVSTAAFKKVGANKYDIANIADTVASVSMCSVGVFGMITSAADSLYSQMSLCTFLSVISVATHSNNRKRNRLLEDKETARILRDEIPYAPTAKPYRPLAYLLPFYFTRLSTDILARGQVSVKETSHSNSQAMTAIIYGALGLAIFADISASYFKDCTMYPPKKGKSWLKRAGSYIKSVFTPEPTPAPQENRRAGFEENVY